MGMSLKGDPFVGVPLKPSTLGSTVLRELHEERLVDDLLGCPFSDPLPKPNLWAKWKPNHYAIQLKQRKPKNKKPQYNTPEKKTSGHDLGTAKLSTPSFVSVWQSDTPSSWAPLSQHKALCPTQKLGMSHAKPSDVQLVWIKHQIHGYGFLSKWRKSLLRDASQATGPHEKHCLWAVKLPATSYPPERPEACHAAAPEDAARDRGYRPCQGQPNNPTRQHPRHHQRHLDLGLPLGSDWVAVGSCWGLV